MQHKTLIIPGFHGSDDGHWQVWLSQQLSNTVIIEGIDWEAPRLLEWTDQIIQEIKKSTQPVWLVAHSFGCLASVRAASTHADNIAGLLLVAPADPSRFVKDGLRSENTINELNPTIDRYLPKQALLMPSIVVASSNDPWVKLTVAAYWAQKWGSHFINIGNAGHINIDSGFGAWPQGLSYLKKLQSLYESTPAGEISV